MIKVWINWRYLSLIITNSHKNHTHEITLLSTEKTLLTHNLSKNPPTFLFIHSPKAPPQPSLHSLQTSFTSQTLHLPLQTLIAPPRLHLFLLRSTHLQPSSRSPPSATLNNLSLKHLRNPLKIAKPSPRSLGFFCVLFCFSGTDLVFRKTIITDRHPSSTRSPTTNQICSTVRQPRS